MSTNKQNSLFSSVATGLDATAAAVVVSCALAVKCIDQGWIRDKGRFDNHQNNNEYYFLSTICDVICRELCEILVQIYILSVFKSDWMTKNDNFSS